MQRVIDHATALGLRVIYRDLGHRSGELMSNGLIVVNYRRSVLTQRVTVAHECGHWWHGHDWSMEHDKARDERQADLYAARLLIDAQAYAAAENLFEGCVGSIAKELGVTRRLVELWRENHFPA